MIGEERGGEDRDIDLLEVEHRPEAWSLLVDALEPSPPDTAQRERLLAQLNGPERWAPFAAEIARVFGIGLAAVREALARMAEPKAWHSGMWPGSQLLITPQLMAHGTVIARLPGGVRIPHHRHAARELTYVLDGVLVDHAGTRCEAGALMEMAPATEHAVSVPEGEDCLVVFAAAR